MNGVHLRPFEVTFVSYGYDGMIAESFFQNIKSVVESSGFQSCKTEHILYTRELNPSDLKGKRVLAIWGPNADLLEPYQDLMKKCDRVGADFLLNVVSHNINASQFSMLNGKLCMNGEINNAVKKWIGQPTTSPAQQAPVPQPVDAFNVSAYIDAFPPVPKPHASLEIIKRISFFLLRIFVAIVPFLKTRLLDRLFPPFEVVLVRDRDYDIEAAKQFLESMGVLNPKIQEIGARQALEADFTGKRVLMINPSTQSVTELDFGGTASDAIRKKCMDVSAKYLFVHQGHWNASVVSDFIKNQNVYFTVRPEDTKNYFDAVIENWKQPCEA